jgi:hypothetical protein
VIDVSTEKESYLHSLLSDITLTSLQSLEMNHIIDYDTFCDYLT